MTEDESKLRQERNFKILSRIGGSLLTVFRPEEPLLLGSDFEFHSTRMFDDLERKRKSIIAELSAYSIEDLNIGFADTGEPMTERWKEWLKAHRQELSEKYGRKSLWYLAPFAKKEQLADFNYWSKAAFLKLDEALWLSVGLQPIELFNRALSDYNPKRQNKDPIADFLKSRRELFRREFDPNGYDRRHRPKAILDWAIRVEFDMHPGFARMLGLVAKRSALDDVSPADTLSSKSEDKFDAREKASLAKLLVAIVITEYGYNPSDLRSPIPKEIQDIAARLGLGISQDTIRKFLQLGAKHLPDDWNPMID